MQHAATNEPKSRFARIMNEAYVGLLVVAVGVVLAAVVGLVVMATMGVSRWVHLAD